MPAASRTAGEVVEEVAAGSVGGDNVEVVLVFEDRVKAREGGRDWPEEGFVLLEELEGGGFVEGVFDRVDGEAVEADDLGREGGKEGGREGVVRYRGKVEA